ncbi:hypothetical protein DSO57_1001077 [Entomophthora muscae]|uniref:Uncharacterized protein n=1 Tax=Entomophthora muscae TaxID=34485 RepID=A0ACC2RP42_9FUNG|nr:hypothetical protein DSO57_1001077 [Entomophthora muscae]
MTLEKGSPTETLDLPPKDTGLKARLDGTQKMQKKFPVRRDPCPWYPILGLYQKSQGTQLKTPGPGGGTKHHPGSSTCLGNPNAPGRSLQHPSTPSHQNPTQLSGIHH